jgi:hypothetical protein
MNPVALFIGSIFLVLVLDEFFETMAFLFRKS